MSAGFEVVKDNENNVHLLSFEEGNNVHFKASLFDLVPMEIVKMNRDKYNVLVFGYLKEYERKVNKIIFIPVYLKKLIGQFYPVFV